MLYFLSAQCVLDCISLNCMWCTSNSSRMTSKLFDVANWKTKETDQHLLKASLSAIEITGKGFFPIPMAEDEIKIITGILFTIHFEHQRRSSAALSLRKQHQGNKHLLKQLHLEKQRTIVSSCRSKSKSNLPTTPRLQRKNGGCDWLKSLKDRGMSTVRGSFTYAK